jgi:uncharacterized membrane protein (UPF0127 family)
MRVVELANARTGVTVCGRCELAVRPWNRMRGLLGRDSLAPDAGMLFSRTGSVHTYRMRFPIDVVFLDKELCVLAVNADVGRGKAVKERGAKWTLELAAGAAAANGVEPGVTLSYEGSGIEVAERRDPRSVGSLFRSANDESRTHAAGAMIGERAPEHEAPSS